MKNTAIPKALRKQAQLRQLKTPNVLAQQAALNTVLLGRKGGSHQTQPRLRERLAGVHAKESRQELNNVIHKE